MVNHVHQGDIIRLQGMKMDALVLSKDFFNESGFAVLCPVLPEGNEGALNIRITADSYTGIVHLENMKGMDLHARHYQIRSQIPYGQIQNISDAVQGIFDYYPY